MSENQGLSNKTVVQVAIVVRDIQAKAKAWAQVLGIEPPDWRLTSPRDLTHINYRGQSTEARAKLAFIDLDSVQLELIEPVGSPSTWADHLEKHGEGLHHIAFRIKGIDHALAWLGHNSIPTIQRGEFQGGRYGYADATDTLGLVLELLEND